MTQDQQRELDRINVNATSEADKWFAMWAILFPGAEPPLSPFVDQDNLGGFIAEEVHRELKPLYRDLHRPAMDDDEFERHHGALVERSRSHFSALSGPLAGRDPLPDAAAAADGPPSAHGLRGILQEPPDNAAPPGEGLSQAMTPSAFLPPTPQAGPCALPEDGGGLDASSSSHTTGPTGDAASVPQQTAYYYPEDTVDQILRPGEASHLMWAFPAGQFRFPMGDNSQYADPFPPMDGYHQDADPVPPWVGSFFDGSGFAPPSPHPDAGYGHPHPPPPIYGPGAGVFQHGPFANPYAPPRSSSQQLHHPAVISQGVANRHGNDGYAAHDLAPPSPSFSPSSSPPGTTGFGQAARHRQSGGNAPEPVGDGVSTPQRRGQHNDGYDRAGSRRW
ncbi:hypothetical protein LX36DRAFT_587863 [Colletotrichum falcatum]|nr:hypothetical protein LX36DRAFT_587863 [Colletotrichum falcatum]